MKIHKNTLYLAVILIIVAGGVMLVSNSSAGIVTGNAVNTAGPGGVQNVKLSVVGGNYVLEPSELKKGVLVRMEADELPGCAKAVRIPAFGVSKTFYEGDNVVEFMPDKAGTFNIACSMNMYTGTFTVLDSDGTKADYVEQKIQGGGSCGSGSGGCGCGS